MTATACGDHVLTARKAAQLLRNEGRQTRGGGEHPWTRERAARYPGTLGKRRRSMSQSSPTDRLPLSQDVLIEQVCGPFEAALQATLAPGQLPRIEDYLSPARRAEETAVLRELVLLEIHY